MANKLAVNENQVYDALRVIVKNRNLPALNYAVKQFMKEQKGK